MEKQEAIDCLNRMVEKAWCSYTYEHARSIWRKFDYSIPRRLYEQISTEFYHAGSAEGIQGKLALRDIVDEAIEYIINN